MSDVGLFGWQVRHAGRQGRCLLFMLAAMVIASTTAAQDSAMLQITIAGIEEIEGAVVIAVFDSEEAFDRRQNPVASALVPVESASVAWSVSIEAPAAYAIVAYQDINENREIDLGRMGVPKEPYGFSNNARRVFGPPAFDEARVLIEPKPYAFEIEIR